MGNGRAARSDLTKRCAKDISNKSGWRPNAEEAGKHGPESLHHQDEASTEKQEAKDSAPATMAKLRELAAADVNGAKNKLAVESRLQLRATTVTKELSTTEFRMKKNALKQQIAAAIQACLEKKAEELSILEMEKGSGAFTDYFVLCSGTNPRQVQAIADEVELRLKSADLRPAHVEGYKQAEWVFIDYVDFVVHVFSEKARKFYDLERLWKSAKRLEPADLK